MICMLQRTSKECAMDEIQIKYCSVSLQSIRSVHAYADQMDVFAAIHLTLEQIIMLLWCIQANRLFRVPLV